MGRYEKDRVITETTCAPWLKQDATLPHTLTNDRCGVIGVTQVDTPASSRSSLATFASSEPFSPA
jgi:hypothetical protein